MQYDGITIHRDWLEQARLMFKSEEETGLAILAILDYAFYDKEPSSRSNKLVQAYLVGLRKRIESQRKKYANMLRAKASYTNTNTNTNTNTTSDKDEEEINKIIERIKNQNNGNK